MIEKIKYESLIGEKGKKRVHVGKDKRGRNMYTCKYLQELVDKINEIVNALNNFNIEG